MSLKAPKNLALGCIYIYVYVCAAAAESKLPAAKCRHLSTRLPTVPPNALH